MNGKTLGFIGLGNMGLPMSIGLIQAGYEVYGSDLSKEAEKNFQEAGGKTGLSIPAIARKADIVMTSLPSPQIVEDIYLGEDGIVDHAHSDLLMIDFSTVAPNVNEKVADAARKKEISYLGVPVSGGIIGAKNQSLSMMVGGEKQLFELAYPIFDVIGGNIFHVGEKPDAGTIVKLINNLYIGFYTQAVGEALTLADHAGIDHETLFDILNVSYGQSGIYERNYKTFISQDNYEPGFTTHLLLKDLGLAEQMADENDVELPIMKQLISMYEKADKMGYSQKDMASMYLFMKNEVQTEAKQRN